METHSLAPQNNLWHPRTVWDWKILVHRQYYGFSKENHMDSAWFRDFWTIFGPSIPSASSVRERCMLYYRSRSVSTVPRNILEGTAVAARRVSVIHGAYGSRSDSSYMKFGMSIIIPYIRIWPFLNPLDPTRQAKPHRNKSPVRLKQFVTLGNRKNLLQPH